MNYIVRILAGSTIGYVFGLVAGGGLISWSITSGVTHPHTGAGIIGFLFVLSFQSAFIGAMAGLMSASSKGRDILWRTVPTGAIVGFLLVLVAVAALGWRVGPKHEYVVAAKSARSVASINILWGAVVGLIVGLCFQPFYKSEVSQSPSPISQGQDG